MDGRLVSGFGWLSVLCLIGGLIGYSVHSHPFLYWLLLIVGVVAAIPGAEMVSLARLRYLTLWLVVGAVVLFFLGDNVIAGFACAYAATGWISVGLRRRKGSRT